ncbi:MAG: hypothetical protein KatS3mg024_0704 [Armatimonadota bacterium]|nr:MAG: hypothetical protein KatS3mg024_0704 [Armatimonadota bacterium]
MRSSILVGLALCLLTGPAVQAAPPQMTPAPDEIVVRGIVTEAPSKGRFTVRATAVRLHGQSTDTLLEQPAPKVVTTTATTTFAFADGRSAGVAEVVEGIEVAVVGKNLGRGQPLPARAVVLFNPESTPAPAPARDEPALPGTSTPPAPGAPAEPEDPRVIRPDSAFSRWRDPAGVEYLYPKDWMPSASPGANPVTFQKGPLALHVRRIPVEAGMDPQGTAESALQVARSVASGKGWRSVEGQMTIAGMRCKTLTITGEMPPRDLALVLGMDEKQIPRPVDAVVRMAFLPVPINPAREPWVLQIAIGGPQARMGELVSAFNRVAQSVVLMRQEAADTPGTVTPMRAANTVQVENALRQVGTALMMYFTDNDDVVPPNWEALRPYLSDPRLLTNLTRGWPNYGVGPVQLMAPGTRVSQMGNPSQVVIAMAAGPGYDIALYADGHVARVRR